MDFGKSTDGDRDANQQSCESCSRGSKQGDGPAARYAGPPPLLGRILGVVLSEDPSAAISPLSRRRKMLRKSLRAADIPIMRQHCAQCLTEVFSHGRPSPTGETLCGPCYAALWGPQASEELRSLVRLHTGQPAAAGRLVPQRI
jgi:hypothetical protein